MASTRAYLMIALPFLILLVVAALCFGLSRVLPTRMLGLGAALAMLLAAAALAWAAGRVGLPAELLLLTWSVPGALDLPLLVRVDSVALATGLLLLVASAVALAGLALALGSQLRGYGQLFGWIVLAQIAGLAALCSGTPLLIPAAWASMALAGFAALQASGGRAASDAPLGLVWSLVAALLLLAGLLAGAVPGAGGGSAVCVLLAVLLATGQPLAHTALDDSLDAPAPLAALLTACGLPLVALGTLWHLADAGALPPTWLAMARVAGSLALLVCSAASLGERRLKRLVGWQISGQGAAFVLAVGLGSTPEAAPLRWALLANGVLAGVVGLLAAGALERAGSDDFTQTDDGGVARPANLVTGAAWALAGAAAVGLPPLWGFWGHQWLVGAALNQGLAVWAVPFVLAASSLSALAFLMPLAAFWRIETAIVPARPDSAGLLALVPVALCLLFGVAPGLAWPLPPTATGRVEQILCVALLVALAVLVALARQQRFSRRLPPNPAAESVALGPDALGTVLRPLDRIGEQGLLTAGLRGLKTLGRWAGVALSLFERRFYLAGVMLALIAMLLLMAR